MSHFNIITVLRALFVILAKRMADTGTTSKNNKLVLWPVIQHNLGEPAPETFTVHTISNNYCLTISFDLCLPSGAIHLIPGLACSYPQPLPSFLRLTPQPQKFCIFFTQSSSSFLKTCPYRLNLFCCSTVGTAAIPNLCPSVTQRQFGP